METFDLTIIGAGPVGLYAAYYAGMRGLKVHLLENFSQAGGQPLNIYPEKFIYDVAGLPKVNGAELTSNLLEQLKRVSYTMTLSCNVTQIISKTFVGDSPLFEILTSKGTFSSKSILLTTGHGLLNPRKLGLEEEEVFEKSGKLAYFVKNLQSYVDQSVAVLGGGDSALDWALMLEPIAKEVHLIHRRKAFRAQKQTLTDVQNSKIEIHAPFILSAITEDGITLEEVKEKNVLHLSVDRILVNYGFITEESDLISGLDLNRSGRVLTTSGMRSNLLGIYAAGDFADYDGKVPLISVGFGEAVIAVNDIAKSIKFDHKIRSGHSSSLFSD